MCRYSENGVVIPFSEEESSVRTCLPVEHFCLVERLSVWSTGTSVCRVFLSAEYVHQLIMIMPFFCRVCMSVNVCIEGLVVAHWE
jgi:hypothetical protein